VLTGAHVVIMSSNAKDDAAFLRDVLELSFVDAGEGFLIFGLPPAEMAMHEAEAASSGKHELYLICEDVRTFVEQMTAAGVSCKAIEERGWGTVTSVVLPSGLELGVYQAHHARPAAKKKAARALRNVAKAVRKASKKSAKQAAKADKKSAKKAAKKVKP
jgi:catechol 2,3-dioxygenase-like lactoylglutathione lyase family enzyme